MRREYAGKLTKEMLIKSGITNITEDGIIYKNDQPMKLITTIGPYKKISIYKFDDNGNKIKADIGRYGTGWYRYDKILIGVHRAIWAWYHNEVPQGFVVDHIDNNKSNNILSNLQLLTQGENLAKDRKKSI